MVNQTGRNDPCPCGSGKKYKKCCLQRDVAAQPSPILDFGYESDLVVRGKAVDKLDALLRETLSRDEVEEFLREFWEPLFVDEKTTKALLADPRTRDNLDRQIPLALRNAFEMDHRYPARYFLEEAPERFSAAEKAFLRRYSEARITFIQMREFFPEEGYTLVEDIFDGKEFRVYDKAFSRSGSPHAIVSARLVPLPDGRGHALEQVGLGVFFPEDKPLILEVLRSEAFQYFDKGGPETRGGVVKPAALLLMLAEFPLLCYEIEFLMAARSLAPARTRLTNTDGDELIQVEARYRCADPAALRAALEAQPNIQSGPDGDREVFHWSNRQGTLVGTARLDASKGELIAETNSRPRHRKWEKKLHTLGALTLIEKREIPFDPEAHAPDGPGNGEPGEGVLSGAALEAVLPQIKAQLAERWLKEKIPMLGGKTPVQAAKTAQGRKELKELFARMESLDARRPKGQADIGMDLEEMKRRLGLPE